MDLVISGTSGVPIYQQLHDQIAAQILTGEIGEGYCLPSIRSVARELGISIITVKKAWERLEDSGHIVTMAGKGCFVAPLVAPDLDDRRKAIALERLRRELPYYRSLGLGKAELLDLIRRVYDEGGPSY